jgi:hypothetical protein
MLVRSNPNQSAIIHDNLAASNDNPNIGKLERSSSRSPSMSTMSATLPGSRLPICGQRYRDAYHYQRYLTERISPTDSLH